MLCTKCRAIDFTASPLITLPDSDSSRWLSLPDSLQPSHISGRYYSYPHYRNLQELFESANLCCHFCVQIRSELFHIRGHETTEEGHDGPVEMRYYPHEDKIFTGGGTIREVVVVIATLIRVIKMTFEFVRFPGQLSGIYSHKIS